MAKSPAIGPLRRPTLGATRPDYGAWVLKDTWSVSEGAKLICGRNPHDKLPGPQLYNRERRVIDIIDQAFEAAQRAEIKVIRSALLPIHMLVDPSSFVRWIASQGLSVPEELHSLFREDPTPVKGGSEILIKDRIMTIARTLLIIDPELSVSEIATHKAMRTLVLDSDALMTDKLRWIAEARDYVLS